MLLSDIYETAAALITELPDGADNADLRDRSVSILYQIVCELLPLDGGATGVSGEYPEKFTGLDEEFPLCGGLAHLAAYKLAYLLCADENTVLCAVLRQEYENARRAYIASLPAAIGGTVDKYR